MDEWRIERQAFSIVEISMQNGRSTTELHARFYRRVRVLLPTAAGDNAMVQGYQRVHLRARIKPKTEPGCYRGVSKSDEQKMDEWRIERQAFSIVRHVDAKRTLYH